MELQTLEPKQKLAFDRKFYHEALYIKNIFEPIILNSCFDFNIRPINNNLVIISGYSAAEKYFENLSDSIDFDIRYVAPKTNKFVNPKLIKSFIDTFFKNVKKLVDLLNNYESHIHTLLGKTVSKYFGVDIYPFTINKIKEEEMTNAEEEIAEETITEEEEEEKEMFRFVKKNDNNYGIEYRLNDINYDIITTIELVHFVAPYPGNPISNEYYQSFIGGNPILSKDNSLYYIPSINIEGIEYAGLGYILWETQQAILDAFKSQNESAYIINRNRFDSMIEMLNHPEINLSCETMTAFITKCGNDKNICTIEGKKYKSDNIEDLVNYGVGIGYLPDDEGFLEKLSKSIPFKTLCKNIKINNKLKK